MSDLEGFREEIDLIDKQITNLFEERMNIVLKIAQYKKENNISVLHSSREEEVISKAVSNLKNKDYETELTTLLNCIMDISKNIQNKKVAKND